MNIFLIPSWYPCKGKYFGGGFVFDQSLLIARHINEIKYFVSVAEYFGISIRNPLSFKNLFAFMQERTKKCEINDKFVEFRSPVVLWSNKVLGGNLRGIINLHRKNLKRALKLEKINVLHAHVSYPAGFVAYILSKEFGIPYVITEHMSPFPFESYAKSGSISKKIKIALDNADKIVGVSSFLKSEMSVYTTNEISIIPNFIDENIFKPSENKNMDDFFCISVGSLVKQKNFTALLKAIQMAQNSINGLKFKIIGDGILRKELEELAYNLKISHLVEFTGVKHGNNIIKEFQECAFCVSSSLHESFGITLIEALACNKPIIATKCGGPEDIVNQSNGILIEKNNPQELAKAIIEMYKHYNNFNANGGGYCIRNDFLDRFSSKVCAGRYYELYKNLKATKCVE